MDPALRIFFDWLSQGGLHGAVLWLGACLLISPLGTLAHEAGHALVARRFGVPVREIVAAPEGPAVVIRRAGFSLRFGLGLARDLKSTEPAGWVLLETCDVDLKHARHILLAGPLAQVAFGLAVMGVAAAGPGSAFHRVLLAFGGLCEVANAIQNLTTTAEGSDGAELRLIAARQAERSRSSARIEDRHAATSIPPPS